MYFISSSFRNGRPWDERRSGKWTAGKNDADQEDLTRKLIYSFGVSLVETRNFGSRVVYLRYRRA
jgi:hypothetical protein